MTRNTRNILLVVGLVLVGIWGIYKSAWMFAPGSYPYAEIYELNYSEENVINSVRQFKKQYPKMTVPKVTIQNNGSYDLEESEGRDNNSSWYFIYFYFPKENQIVFTWTKPNGKRKTSLALVSLNSGLDIGHWKDINKDFIDSENRQLKRNFEERIIKPIENILRKQK